jgi:hypothetical protein
MKLWSLNPEVENKGLPSSSGKLPLQRRQDDSRLIVRKAFSVLAVGVLLALFFFLASRSSSIAYFYYSWKLSHEDTFLRVVPRPLATSGVSKISSPQLSYYGVKFETPWKQVSRVQQESSLVRVQFDGGQFVVLFDPTKRVNRLKISTDAALAKGRDVSEVYGRDAVKSNYAFLHAILYLTPDQISLFSGWKRFVRDGAFLQFKHMEAVGAQTGLFCFKSGRLQGFQKGDPYRADIVILDAFDDSDREYEVWVGRTRGTQAAVNQEDINAILSTLEALPGAQPERQEGEPAISSV